MTAPSVRACPQLSLKNTSLEHLSSVLCLYFWTSPSFRAAANWDSSLMCGLCMALEPFHCQCMDGIKHAMFNGAREIRLASSGGIVDGLWCKQNSPFQAGCDVVDVLGLVSVDDDCNGVECVSVLNRLGIIRGSVTGNRCRETCCCSCPSRCPWSGLWPRQRCWGCGGWPCGRRLPELRKAFSFWIDAC